LTETLLDAELMDDGASRGLVRRAPGDVVLMPVMNVQLAKRRMEELQEFCAGYLQESRDGGTDGGDYGIIPGAGQKKVLLKSGAEKLCDVYGLADRYRILSKVEDFDHGLFDYTIECVLVRKTDEMFVGSGLGTCSSYEAKYRWRDSRRVCPRCHKDAIIKGKAEYGGGWLCWKNKGGCGEKFADTDPAIIGQATGRVENPDIVDTKNTVLKMAKKRAKIDAVIGVTRSSGIFSQDLEEHLTAEADESHGTVNGTPTTATSTPRATTAPAQTAPPANETHEQKINRIKAEAAAKFAKQPAQTQPSSPSPSSQAPSEPATTEPTLPMDPPMEPVAAPAGKVFITGINVKNGAMVVKDGVTKPSWGPLYIITFSAKVQASDGQMVADATTFDEVIAAAAETARDAQTPVTPRVDPGKKKGSFTLMELTT
jgi:hypothetical protein